MEASIEKQTAAAVANDIATQDGPIDPPDEPHGRGMMTKASLVPGTLLALWDLLASLVLLAQPVVAVFLTSQAIVRP